MVLFPTIVEAQYGPTEGSEYFQNDDTVLEFSSSTVIVSSNTTQTITLDSMAPIFHDGDILKASGHIIGPSSSAIFSRVSDPDNGFISQRKWSVNSDNTFSISHSLGGHFYPDGIYNLDLRTNKASLSTYFWFDSNEIDRKWTDFLIVDNYQYIQENCDNIDCEKIPRMTSPVTTTFTWFNPNDSTSYLILLDYEYSIWLQNSEEILPQNIFSYTIDSPGFYVYVITSKEAFSNSDIQMIGIIEIDDEAKFSSGTVIVSSSTTSIEMEEFSSTEVILSSATEAYIKGNSAKIKVPPGTSVPGCETTLECFIPSNLSIDQGATVIWLNYDDAAHTITGGSAADGPSGIFDSSLFMAGTTYSHTFENPGAFEYFCMVHPWMRGIVNVLDYPLDNPNTTSNSGSIIDDSPVLEPSTNAITIDEFIAKSTLEINDNPVNDPTLADIQPTLVDWANEIKTDSEFIDAIKLVIDEDTISNASIGPHNFVPDWLKTDVIWWSEGLISDEDFLYTISYLIQENILVMSDE